MSMRSGMASPPALAGVAASAAILLTNWSWISPNFSIIDVEHSAAVFEIEASIVAMKAVTLHNVAAAAKNVRGLIKVDIALDIRRHTVGKARRIVGDQ